MINDTSVAVTGCSRGLGLALAQELAHRKRKVFGIYRDETRAPRDLEPYFYPLIADLARDDAEEELKAQMEKYDCPIDVLINNAGIPGTQFALENASTEEVRRLFEVHVLGVMRATKACLPYLRRSRNPAIINISSRFGSLIRVSKGSYSHFNVSYAYGIAKAAQNMLTLAMSGDNTLSNVQILAIHPGEIRTTSSSPDAVISPKEAAERLINFVERRTEIGSGLFCELDGSAIPW